MSAAISHAPPPPEIARESAPDAAPVVAPPIAPVPVAWEQRLRRVQTSAWLVSAVFHLAALVMFGLFVAPARNGTGGADGRLIEIQATMSSQGPDYYDEPSETVVSAPATTNPAVDNPATTSVATSPAFAIEAPSEPSAGLLPAAGDAPGAIGADNGPPLAASSLTTGSRRPTVRLPSGKTRASLFGVSGEGNSFIFVFDRSESMEGDGSPGPTPLTRAKAELLASLEGLEDTNQFQLIFYNQEPRLCNLTGQGQLLFWATRENKRAAADFVAGIRGSGGTEHEPALMTALKLRPDVIFFLTDGDQPSLSAAQLDTIARRNGGRASIHTIQFGDAPSPPRDNFLIRLARQNGGEYGYVDISAPPPREAR